MRNILIILLIGITYISSYSQTKDIVHLSFNIKEDEKCPSVKKKIKNSNEIHFYINNEHFEWNSKRNLEKIPKSKIRNINILSIYSFLELAEDKRKKLINEGQEDKLIKVLFNNQVFDKIYLYEKDSYGKIKKYNVKWIEEIE